MDVEVEIDLGINVGMKFMDLTEFQDNLKAVCKSRFVQFFINASRTVEAAKNKVKRYLNPQLKFYTVHWACIHGGREYKSRGKGIRKTKTLRKENLCPAHIHIIISEDGNTFVVSAVNNKHNHLVAEQLFKQLPHNRKLPSDIKDDVRKLLHMKVNKQMLRAELEKKLNKKITVKDLWNIQLNNKETTNNMKNLGNKLQARFGTDCHFLLDENDAIKGLTFCTKEMTSLLSSFPELICIDVTYKLLDIKAALYTILNEYSNGESGIVCVAILIQEDEDSLEWFLETFKKCNTSSWYKIKNIISDRDLIERDVLKNCFPDAQQHICFFHVLKIFHREFNCEKFKITPNTRTKLLESLQSLMYAQNELQFQKILQKIKLDFSETVFTYLCEQWVDIRKEWCPFLGIKIHNFIPTTNDGLEKINAKLKAICQKHSTLEDFVDDLFTAISSLQKEKNTRIAYLLNKRKVIIYGPDDFRHSYAQFLTPFAFTKLETQFSFSNVLVSFDESLQLYKVKCKNTQYITTCESCTCYFSQFMGMPCKHIFAVRNFCGKNLFEPELVIDRWKNTYFLENCSFLCDLDRENIPTTEHSTFIDKLPTENYNESMTSEEKYRKTFVKAKLIATLAADICGSSYFHVNNVLDKVITNLQNSNYDFDIDINEHIPDTDTNMYEHVEHVEQNIFPEEVISEEDVIYNEEIITEETMFYEDIDSEERITENVDIQENTDIEKRLI